MFLGQMQRSIPMHTRIRLFVLALLLAWPPLLAAQDFDSGSDGSDGALVINSDTEIDLGQANGGPGTGTYDPSTQVSSLACGARVNSVANLDATRRVINPSSSRGPTRAGEDKPDLAAPGTDVVAANGFGDDSWISMTGTSMAAPYVTGVVGLMMAVDPTLTAAQISSILRRTAEPLPDHTFTWREDAGFGEIDADRAIAETLSFKKMKP